MSHLEQRELQCSEIELSELAKKIEAEAAMLSKKESKLCKVKRVQEQNIVKANYSISSKQYVENGIHMKVLSKGKPNENCVLDNDITLEDAYIYLTNS